MIGDSAVTVHALGQRRKREREIDLQQLANRQPHIGDLRDRESLQRRRDLVDARRQRRKAVVALVVGDRGLNTDERRARGLTVAPGKDRAR